MSRGVENGSPEVPRVLLAKPGLDGHDRGIKVIARTLRDAGMDVIYLGLRCTPSEVAAAAVDEDVDVIGLSNLSAALVSICERLQAALQLVGASDIPVVAGGTILQEDVEQLEAMGISAVFGPGTPTKQIVEHVRELARGRHAG